MNQFITWVGNNQEMLIEDLLYSTAIALIMTGIFVVIKLEADRFNRKGK